jgi:hypothetical protein
VTNNGKSQLRPISLDQNHEHAAKSVQGFEDKLMRALKNGNFETSPVINRPCREVEKFINYVIPIDPNLKQVSFCDLWTNFATIVFSNFIIFNRNCGKNAGELYRKFCKSIKL